MNQISTGSFHLQKFQILPNKTNSVLKKRICYNHIQLIPGKQEYFNLRKFINISDESDKATTTKTPILSTMNI